MLLSLNGMNRNQPLINWANANAEKCGEKEGEGEGEHSQNCRVLYQLGPGQRRQAWV